jgi:CDP-diacylglycerol--serine O-phosphatidyltransferase
MHRSPPIDAPHIRSRRRAVRERIRQRTLGPISVVPTMLTLANLVCGFAAIHYATKPFGETALLGWTTITLAGSLIFLGMFFDAIDGSVARLTRSTSDLGAQLDSIADIVSFGVAPAFLMLGLVDHYYRFGGDTATPAFVGPGVDSAYGKAVWAIAALYVCGAGLRLARFNAETPSHAEDDHLNFKGLPTPGAAGAVASLIVLQQHLLHTSEAAPSSITFAKIAALAIPIIALLCALGMVSSLPYPHVVNRYLRRGRDFQSLVRIALPVMAAIWFMQETVAIACTTYALSGPLRGLARRRRDDLATTPDVEHDLEFDSESPQDLDGPLR